MLQCHLTLAGMNYDVMFVTGFIIQLKNPFGFSTLVVVNDSLE